MIKEEHFLFLIEIIQGTYPENFNDLTTSVDELSNFGIVENINKHNQFLDYLDQDLLKIILTIKVLIVQTIITM